MKWCIWMTGKTTPAFYREACGDYLGRIGKLIDIEERILPDIKNAARLPADVLKKKESEQVLLKLLPNDMLVLLDEKGKSFTSEAFATWMEKNSLSGSKRCIFVIGGAFGFDGILYDRAQMLLSLSAMTLSHQLIRVVFLEQLYRGSCINKGIPYHHA